MGNEWAVGFWGVGFHFQRRVGAFWLEFLVSGRGLPTGKKKKAFRLFQHKGFQHREGGGFYCGGFWRARRTFPARAQAGGGGAPAGSRVGFVRVGGVLLEGLFRRGDREGSNGVAGRVSTKKKSFSSGVALQGG